MKKHILDKPILRNIFWFIVLPNRLDQFYTNFNMKTPFIRALENYLKAHEMVKRYEQVMWFTVSDEAGLALALAVYQKAKEQYTRLLYGN